MPANDPFAYLAPVLPTILAAGEPDPEDYTVDPEEPDRLSSILPLVVAAAQALTARTRDDFQEALAQQPRTLAYIDSLYERERQRADKLTERNREDLFRTQDRAERAQGRQAETSRFQRTEAAADRRLLSSQDLQRELAAGEREHRDLMARRERAHASARDWRDRRDTQARFDEEMDFRRSQAAGRAGGGDGTLQEILKLAEPTENEILVAGSYEKALEGRLGPLVAAFQALGGQGLGLGGPPPEPAGPPDLYLEPPTVADLTAEDISEVIVKGAAQGGSGGDEAYQKAKELRRANVPVDEIRERLYAAIDLASTNERWREHARMKVERALAPTAIETIVNDGAGGGLDSLTDEERKLGRYGLLTPKG